MMPVYNSQAVTVYAYAEVSTMLNVQVNCAGNLYSSDECKMAIADFERDGGAYIPDGDRQRPRKIAMSTRH